MKKKGIILDYGGTLDTNGVHWANIIWEAYQEKEIAISESNFREAYIYAERYLAKNPVIRPCFTFKDLMETKIAIEFDYLQENRIIGKGKETAIQYIAHSCYKKAKETTRQSEQVIHKLSDKYELVLVSNFYGNIEAVLSDFGLKRYFPKIIESSVVGIRKPDPQIFRLGIDALNQEAEETVVIGDSYKKDIIPAKACGCQTIWIKGKGWDKEEESDTFAADYTIDRLNGVISILL